MPRGRCRLKAAWTWRRKSDGEEDEEEEDDDDDVVSGGFTVGMIRFFSDSGGTGRLASPSMAGSQRHFYCSEEAGWGYTNKNKYIEMAGRDSD